MSSLARALYKYVVDSALVTAEIGLRFRPGRLAPVDLYPFADYLITDERAEHYSSAATGLAEVKWRPATVEVVVFHDRSYDEADRIADVIKARILTLHGTVSGVSGVAVRSVRQSDKSDEPDLGNNGQSKGPFAVRRVFTVNYGRS